MNTLLILFVYIRPCYEYDLHVYIRAVSAHVFPECVCVCVCASGRSLQLSVFIYSCSQCASGTAALRPASPEAKECPLFLLLLPASLTLLAHTLSRAAGASARPGPNRPAGHLGRLNPSALTWTCARSGSWEGIHNRENAQARGKEEQRQREPSRPSVPFHNELEKRSFHCTVSTGLRKKKTHTFSPIIQ